MDNIFTPPTPAPPASMLKIYDQRASNREVGFPRHVPPYGLVNIESGGGGVNISSINGIPTHCESEQKSCASAHTRAKLAPGKTMQTKPSTPQLNIDLGGRRGVQVLARDLRLRLNIGLGGRRGVSSLDAGI